MTFLLSRFVHCQQAETQFSGMAQTHRHSHSLTHTLTHITRIREILCLCSFPCLTSEPSHPLAQHDRLCLVDGHISMGHNLQENVPDYRMLFCIGQVVGSWTLHIMPSNIDVTWIWGRQRHQRVSVCVCTRTGKPVFNLTCPSWTSHHSDQGGQWTIIGWLQGDLCWTRPRASLCMYVRIVAGGEVEADANAAERPLGIIRLAR